MSPTLESIRETIDDADDILLRALGARLEAVRHLREYKKIEGLPAEDKEREAELKEKWKERAAELKIPKELALLILDFLLTESKRIQK